MKSIKHRDPLKERSSKRRAEANVRPVSELHSNSQAQSRDESVIPIGWQRKTGKAHSLLESFYHAFHGIKVGLRGQRNLRIHFAAAPLVVVMGLFLHIDSVSWLALVFVMALVISTEFMNTAIEHLVDISAEGQYKYAARCAKDTAASAVLIASLAAIIVGALVFVPKFVALF
ncbi:MAG: diacylglycerol kinase family protein [Candidatus Obscuribacterales bacterium]|nr:diacylglycerol kinase family protein [Candidatus Obscuribacterales bacterium]